MTKNEQGFAFLPILFFISLLLLYLTASIPRALSSKQSIQNEWGKFQAERNAEAGAYLAVSEWNDQPVPYKDKWYVLSDGTAQVTVKKQSEDVIEIISIGRQRGIYTDRVSALYDSKQGQWMNWTR